MFSKLRDWISTPPAVIRPECYRTFVAFNVGALGACGIHLTLLPVFAWLGAYELIALNILSLGLYLTALFANRRGHHTTMMVLCLIELSGHQAACAESLGWGAGFQYYLMAYPAFALFLSTGRRAFHVVLAALSGVAFIAIMIWARGRTPLHVLPPHLEFATAAFNAAAVFALLSLFALAFRGAADAAEARLAAHERQAAEQRLLLLRAAVTSAQDAISITDADARIVYANPAFCASTGYSEAELVGQRMSILRSGAQATEFYAELWATIRAGRPWSGRIVNRRKDGTLYADATTITPIAGEDGHPQHFLAVKHDMTADEAAAARLRDTEDQLRHAKKMEAIGTLAGGVAHDFNNLLTIILGTAAGMVDVLTPDHPAHADLAEIEGAAQRAAALTRQLLAYGRKQVLSLRVLQVNSVVLGIEKLLRRSVNEQVRFTLSLGDALPPVEVDEGQLGQVLLNLAVNAADAMPGGGALVVRTRGATLSEPTRFGSFVVPPGRYVLLEVADTGSGIEAHILPHIFEPFYTTKGLGKGTGLGLSTVYGIVTQCGGHVAVESQLGLGTTFHVFLPAAGSAPPSAARAAAEPADRAGLPAVASDGTETVLIVEDEAAVRTITRRMLQSAGFTVVEAEDGVQALALIEGGQMAIDAVLSDVMMPGLDGPTLAARARALRPGLPFVHVSGYPGEVIGQRGTFVPGLNFLAKPFSAQELAATLRAAIDGRPSQA